MDVYAIHAGGGEELLVAGLSRAEVNDIKEWFWYTKPLGADVKILVRNASEVLDSLVCAGTEGGSCNPEQEPSLAA